ncbi:uncharacterized protein BYT42DRAFT_565680 [Radiomyces spectabilis]|uniref:uncharacterized protein n=1 Tax=Radiomyces spectabilis TaxID=64574 RepID=UPI0022208213|nr:uncharacterized protein BYT42DRAFT_565680 [Radiomyces spectabilis]KAI8381207.1 hypothetical protein BYT42DRAFT_565680 [Radiomyces spectabilis]
MDEQKEPARKWIVQGKDMTAHLIAYRKRSIKLARSEARLEDSHILSLSFIYILSPNDPCAVSSLPPLQQYAVFENLLQTRPHVSDDLWDICEETQYALARNQDVRPIFQRKFLECDDEMYYCIDILSNLIKFLPAKKSHQVETAIIDTVKAFVISSLNVDGAKGEWQTYHMPYVDSSSGKSTSMMPDYVMYAQPTARTNFDLFFVEVKSWPNKGNKHETDTIKLGKEMKLGIDKLVNRSVEDPMTVGMLVEGCHVKTYYMDLKFDGQYRMVEMARYKLPGNRVDGLLIVPPVLESMKQMKLIIEHTMKSLYAAVKAGRPKTPSGLSGFVRSSCGSPTMTRK